MQFERLLYSIIRCQFPALAFSDAFHWLHALEDHASPIQPWELGITRDCLCLHGMVMTMLCSCGGSDGPLLMFPRNIEISSFVAGYLFNIAKFLSSGPSSRGALLA